MTTRIYDLFETRVMRSSFTLSLGSLAEADAEGGDFGFSRANTKVHKKRTVVKMFWNQRYDKKFSFPIFGEWASSALMKKEGIANPRMHPIGKARLPRAVARALSLSENQTVASLLAVLVQKG